MVTATELSRTVRLSDVLPVTTTRSNCSPTLSSADFSVVAAVAVVAVCAWAAAICSKASEVASAQRLSVKGWASAARRAAREVERPEFVAVDFILSPSGVVKP